MPIRAARDGQTQLACQQRKLGAFFLRVLRVKRLYARKSLFRKGGDQVCHLVGGRVRDKGEPACLAHKRDSLEAVDVGTVHVVGAIEANERVEHRVGVGRGTRPHERAGHERAVHHLATRGELFGANGVASCLKALRDCQRAFGARFVRARADLCKRRVSFAAEIGKDVHGASVALGGKLHTGHGLHLSCARRRFRDAVRSRIANAESCFARHVRTRCRCIRIGWRRGGDGRGKPCRPFHRVVVGHREDGQAVAPGRREHLLAAQHPVRAGGVRVQVGKHA